MRASMAQLSIERHDSIEKEESFICETAKLAQLVAEQGEQKILIQNECYIVGKGMGVRAKESSASSQACSASEEETARNLGFMLRDIAGRYEKQLSDEFDTSTSSPWDVNYSVFRTICSNVLRRTISSVTNRWDQTLLVFAGYMRLREALHDSERQNEISSYVGRYLSDMGFQSWIQLQGGWQHVGEVQQSTDNSPFLPPEGTPV